MKYIAANWLIALQELEEVIVQSLICLCFVSLFGLSTSKDNQMNEFFFLIVQD